MDRGWKRFLHTWSCIQEQNKSLTVQRQRSPSTSTDLISLHVSPMALAQHGSSLWHLRPSWLNMFLNVSGVLFPSASLCVSQVAMFPGSQATKRLSSHTYCPLMRHKSLPLCDTWESVAQSVHLNDRSLQTVSSAQYH